MAYESLLKAHYKNKDVEKIYLERYTNPFAKHLPMEIKQYNQTKSYPAFYCYTEDIVLLTEQIYEKNALLSQIISSIPGIALRQYGLSCILDEVQSTNDIEGVYSTKKQLREIINGTSSSKRFDSVVQKYIRILQNQSIFFNTNEDIRTFYDEFAHNEVIEDNPTNKLDGNLFRKEPVDVANASGKTIHQGVFPEEKLCQYMSESLSILNDTSIPFLVRVSLFHYLFAYIHPFYDGNGRTDRFITSYYLSQKFHFSVALRLSITIKKHRKQYYKLFQDTENAFNYADLTSFIIGFLSIISHTIDDITTTMTRKKEQLTKYTDRIEDMNITDETLRQIYHILLQASLFYGEGLTLTNIMSITGKSRATVQKRLDSIPDDFLIKMHRKSYFYKLNLIKFKKI